MPLFKLPNNAPQEGIAYPLLVAKAQYRPVIGAQKKVMSGAGLSYHENKTRKMVGRGAKPQMGGDFWTDAGNWIQGAVNTVDEGLKKTKILSNSAEAVGGFLGGLAGPEGILPGTIAGRFAGDLLRNQGYGPEQTGGKRRKKQVGAGGGLINNVSKVKRGKSDAKVSKVRAKTVPINYAINA